jgi:hypothetical protein
VKNLLYGVLGLVLGIGLFVGGLSSMPSGEVKCGERVMSPGDTCTTIRNGRATNRSYDEQKSKDGREGVIMMIVGPLLAIGCGVVFLGPALVRRRKNEGYVVRGPGAAVPGYAGPPAAYPPAPGHGPPGHPAPPTAYPAAPAPPVAYPAASGHQPPPHYPPPTPPRRNPPPGAGGPPPA